ncbi:hypothetical protein ACFQ4P_00715 [Lacticaseibacillus mingshuiensis]|uniref:Uncharacterized protein n=1 Tax=Lacticaseibacillus mingshuiensis TaxID=2799574 RepID=A0ABW4CDA8_9LACO
MFSDKQLFIFPRASVRGFFSVGQNEQLKRIEHLSIVGQNGSVYFFGGYTGLVQDQQ